jgi:hypothetical protein
MGCNITVFQQILGYVRGLFLTQWGYLQQLLRGNNIFLVMRKMALKNLIQTGVLGTAR